MWRCPPARQRSELIRPFDQVTIKEVDKRIYSIAHWAQPRHVAVREPAPVHIPITGGSNETDQVERIGVSLSGALILAACGQQSGESAEPAGSDGTGGSQAPSAGAGTGTISYAIDGQLTTLSNANSDVPTAEAFGFIAAALYQYEPR